MKMKNNRYTLVSGAFCGIALCLCTLSAPEVSAQTATGVVAPTDAAEGYSFDGDSWRKVFADSQLQRLIECGLAHNTDLNVARLRISEAEATLKSARLANLPSLAFSPSAGISSFGGERASKTYSLPLQASWQIDLFGKLKNAKMQQKMLVESSKAYRQAVQVNLVASIAREYYNCALLHAQLSLARQSVDVLERDGEDYEGFHGRRTVHRCRRFAGGGEP